MEGSKGSPTDSYYVRYSFEAMPTEQLEAALEIPCLMNDTAFRDWRLEIISRLRRRRR
jgi:hypothetical protein